MDLDDLNFIAHYQLYTLGLFLSRCGYILSADNATLTDGNSWAAPFFTAGFSTSDNASVPATQLELDASLFVASHFFNRPSRHHNPRDCNLARKQMMTPYFDLVELPCYHRAQARGLAATNMNMEGQFQPNRSPTTSSVPPFLLVVPDPSASPPSPASTQAQRDHTNGRSKTPPSMTQPNLVVNPLPPKCLLSLNTMLTLATMRPPLPTPACYFNVPGQVRMKSSSIPLLL